MVQMTEAARAARIKELLNELKQFPPEKHETASLPGVAGQPLLCEVISIGVDEVLLNHRSHRVRAQLEDDPEWGDVEGDPHGEAAQTLIQRHVRSARKPDEFKELKHSLSTEGQTSPGVMTHKGVLVNANTRVVALRELDDPAKRYVRVAVLPPTVTPDELSLLELRLQMQKELKVDYSMTNELLFIEELSVERGLTNEQIARELRISPDNEKKGATEVGQRLLMLDLLRDLRRIPTEPLRLTFFDENQIRYEQLKEVMRNRASLLDSADETEARRYLETFLLSVSVGVTPVHQIRKLDADFVESYAMPQLEDDEIVGPMAQELLKETDDKKLPKGVDALSPGSADTRTELVPLIDAITQSDTRVKISGTPFVIDQETLRGAVGSAFVTAIKEKGREQAVANKLDAPAERLKSAAKELAKCLDDLLVIKGDSNFDEAHRKTAEAAYKRVRRTMKKLEGALVDAQVISGS